jgi:hypothetical protein
VPTHVADSPPGKVVASHTASEVKLRPVLNMVWLTRLDAEANNQENEKDRTMTTALDLNMKVTARDRASMDRQLDEAVAVAKARAMRERRQGILVTRHAHDSFTVALSDAVPFGTTLEHQAW